MQPMQRPSQSHCSYHSHTSRKTFEGNTLCQNNIDVCINHDLIALHKNEKKFQSKFRVKTRKRFSL